MAGQCIASSRGIPVLLEWNGRGGGGEGEGDWWVGVLEAMLCYWDERGG